MHASPLPWLATRRLLKEEVNQLKNGNPISLEQIEPPTWNVPQNFPPPTPLIRGVQDMRFNFILERYADQLRSNRLLRGGIEL